MYLEVLVSGFVKFDWMIFVFMLINLRVFYYVSLKANILYSHFNTVNRTSKLNYPAQRKLQRVANKEKKELTDEDIMDIREKMNFSYGLYYNLTSMFPLFGMLGTVFSLIPLVNQMGEINVASFFAALTSTLWGIVFALVFKLLDSFVSYKIEDVEKRMTDILSSGL